MPYAAWLVFVAITGWAAGEIVGGNDYGRLTDILLGISGALLVRFVVESAGIKLHDIYLLLFSVWGAAMVSVIFRLSLRHRETVKRNRATIASQH
jgi:uncharacterized membrane protein YeaQ/YmgE (transglycosylase-associated protein family)